MAKVYFVRRDYVRALAMSKTAMFLMPESGLSTLELLELKLVASLSLQGLGRVEESTLWLREAVEVAVREQVLLPLLARATPTARAIFGASWSAAASGSDGRMSNGKFKMWRNDNVCSQVVG